MAAGDSHNDVERTMRGGRQASPRLAAVVAAAAMIGTSALVATPAAAGAEPVAGDEAWVLQSTEYRPQDFAEQPLVGNGYLGARLPALGSGWAGGGAVGESNWPLDNHRSTTSMVAGVYQRSGSSDYVSTLPTWTDLSFAVDGHVLDPSVPATEISGFAQSLDMRTGTVTTSFDWTPVAGRTAAVTYTVLANRERMHLAQVRATFVPSWSGDVTVTSLLNGAGVQRIAADAHDVDLATDTSTVSLTTQGRGTQVAMASRLVAGAGVTVSDRTPVLPSSDLGTAGEAWTVPVTSGTSYELTKYVGVSTSNDQGAPTDVALQSVQDAVATGWAGLVAEHRDAWSDLWARHITVDGQPELQAAINSAFYLLYASLRDGISFSIPPSGLSSDNYAGVIFWDAETWMYPAILALHPELARSIVQFRYDTIGAARQNAQTAGYQGATWPWDDGPSGRCGGLAGCKGYQDHLQSDIALAQWQYFQATGDVDWLRDYGYPVIQGVAQFWASRVTTGSDGRLHVNGVSSSDEYAGNKNDDAMTNAGAIVSLRDAIAAAQVLGETPDPQWATVAQNIVVPLDPDGSHPEYAGYTNQQTKQASVVLMTYPFGYVTDRTTAAADLNRYMPVTDTGGPAMTASVEAVVASQVREPGCLDFTRFQDSYLPFLRGSFRQFNETQYLTPSAGQSYPAFSFGTGAGGFLQTLAYGFTGLRWDAEALRLDPTLPPQLAPGITITGLQYHGSSVDVRLGADRTTISLASGEPVRVGTPAGEQTLSTGHDVTIDTARPDLDPTDNLARCKDVSASSSVAVNRAAAAVDGNRVTSWIATGTSSSLTVDLGEETASRHARIVWGTTRPATYAVDAWSGGAWTQVAAGPVASSGDLDALWDDLDADRLRFRFDGGQAASVAELELLPPGAADVITSFDVPSEVQPGATTRVTVHVDSVGGEAATGVSARLSLPAGWTSSPVDALPSTLSPGAAVTTSWDVTAPGAAATAPVTVSVTVSWQGEGTVRSRTDPASVYVIPAVPVGTTLEAEDMVRAGGAGKATDHPGYTGSGFVSGLYHGASLTGLVAAPAHGIYPVTLRYANSAGGQTAPYVAKTRTLSLVTAAGAQQLQLPTGANWDTWVTVTAYVTLEAGDDLLRIVVRDDDDGSVNLDSLSVGTTPVDYVPSLRASTTGIRPGAPVTFRGTGFAPGESVTFTWSGSAPTSPWTATADAAGGVSSSVTPPAGTANGLYTAVASGETSALPVTASVYVIGTVDAGSPMEAEAMLRAGGVGEGRDHGGYTGTGFASSLYAGASLTGLVAVPVGGVYPLTFRYANHVGGQAPGPYVAKTRTMSLVVGGQTQRVEFPVGASWDDWVSVTVQVPFVEGDDLVRLVVGPDDDGSINLDSLTVADVPIDQQFAPVLDGPEPPVEPGTSVTIAGSGFAPGETVSFTTAPSLASWSVTADRDGGVSTSFVVPSGTADGAYEVRAVGGSSLTPAVLPVEVRKVTRPTTAAVSGVPASVVQGTPVTASVSVTAGATGTVELFDGATSLGTSTLNVGSKAAVVLPSLAVGAHSLTARYTGDGTYLPSTSAPVSVTVTAPQHDTGLTGPSAPVEPGATVPITGVGFAADEVVTFTTTPAVVASWTVSASGAGEVSTSFTVPAGTADGSIEVRAVGATSSAPATAVVQVRHVTHTTTTTVSGAPVATDPVTPLQVVVTVTAGATGQVELFEGATSLGAATLDGTSAAVIAVPPLGLGAHTLTARYAGDGTYLASTSDPVTVLSQKRSSQTSVLGAPSTAVEGEEVPVVVGVTAGATGQVELFEGATSLGAATLDGESKATVTVGPLGVGVHVLRAVYHGDDLYLDSASEPATVTIAAHLTPPASVTVSVPVLSRASQAYGSKPGLLATLSSQVSGATSGTVTFRSGTRVLGSAPVVRSGAGYVATLRLPATLAKGAYRGLTATFVTGDGRTAVSVASAATFRVVKASAKKVTVKAKKFKAGTRPKVKVKVATLSNGHKPVGKVKVKVGKKVVKTARLKAKKNGKITVKLPKKYSGTIKVKATFVPKDKKVVKTAKSKAVKIKTAT